MAADFRNGAAREGKIQHAHFPGVRNVNAEFLPDLPQHTLRAVSPGSNFPPGPLTFPAPIPLFLRIRRILPSCTTNIRVARISGVHWAGH